MLAASPARAQQGYGYALRQPAETPASALDRYIRALATDPKDFASLIGAGKAAIAIGDQEAAAGFFARADEVNPRSPLPQAGMGAVAVANGDARGAMPYFTRALQLGATVPLIGSDRGLAFDLLGMQAQAQADYRSALAGPDGDEARRRMALSLAISGDRAGALQTIAPLQARGDPASGRTRAFILGLTGDANGAMAAANAAMPGSWASVSPFIQRLPGLAPGDKAAAVNLGIFPDSGAAALASVSAPPTYPAAPAYAAPPVANLGTNSTRLASIDQLLSAPPQPPPSPPAPPTAAQPLAQIAYSIPAVQQIPPPAPVPTVQAPAVQAAGAETAVASRVWLQLASGPNAAALPGQFRRIKSKGRDAFAGIHGYVVSAPDRARLLIGPFRNSDDAEIFAQGLEELDISAFSWTNSPGDTIVPLDEAG